MWDILHLLHLSFPPNCVETYTSYLPESVKGEDLISHWYEIKINCKNIDWKEVCGTILPNEPDIIASPNNCKFILRPVDHSKMKHCQILA